MGYLLLSLINGNENGLGDGALVCVLAIILVFAILSIIIGIAFASGKMIEKSATGRPAQTRNVNDNVKREISQPAKLDVTDEDKVVATLVASIDYRNEIKKDIKVISVKEIK